MSNHYPKAINIVILLENLFSIFRPSEVLYEKVQVLPDSGLKLNKFL